jgi:hypothetical protein
MRLSQILALYRDNYISLASAKGLAFKYAGDLALRVNWIDLAGSKQAA